MVVRNVSEWPDYVLFCWSGTAQDSSRSLFMSRYYCQGSVARSILVKKKQNISCSKSVFTKQPNCPGTTDKRICSSIIIADERQRAKFQQELSSLGWVLISLLLVEVRCAPFSPKGRVGEKPWSPTDYNTQRCVQVWLRALPQNNSHFT